MFSEPGTPHRLAHFHAYYQDAVAVYGIDPVQLIAGSLPRSQQRLVEQWAQMHRADLLADWLLLIGGQPARPIQPLE
jgi:hypothetical protein